MPDLMSINQRKEYADSIYDDLRMLIMLKRFDRELNRIWCVACSAYFAETPQAHIEKHFTATPPPEFS